MAELKAVVAVSCLAGNGRLDITAQNAGPQTVLRAEVTGLSARQASVASGDWWRQSFTGRADGTYTINLTATHGGSFTETLTVACDQPVPAVHSDEIQVLTSCRAGLGYVWFQFVNPDPDSQVYVIEFAGVSNRSTTAAPFAASVRGVSGRPDGIYAVTVRDGGTTIFEQFPVIIDCD